MITNTLGGVLEVKNIIKERNGDVSYDIFVSNATVPTTRETIDAETLKALNNAKPIEPVYKSSAVYWNPGQNSWMPVYGDPVAVYVTATEKEYGGIFKAYPFIRGTPTWSYPRSVLIYKRSGLDSDTYYSTFMPLEKAHVSGECFRIITTRVN